MVAKQNEKANYPKSESFWKLREGTMWGHEKVKKKKGLTRDRNDLFCNRIDTDGCVSLCCAATTE